jgi:hypothetical protein
MITMHEPGTLDLTRGMTRRSDSATSRTAARGVQRETLKSRVLQFASDAGPGGFRDCDLLTIDPARPESSFRKRRCELVETGWIVDAGFTRKNDHDQDSTVWIHRRFAHNPPPLGKQPKPKKRTAEEERAAIVAWLRRPDADEMDKIILGWTADEIERGDHLK